MPIDLSTLPDDLDALRALVAVQAATIARQETELDGQRSRIEQLQLARLRRMQFGRSSEKLDAAIAQLELEDLEEESGAETVLRPPVEELAASDTLSRLARRALPEHLPRDVVEHAAACACPAYGGVLRRLGEDVTEALEYVPG